MTGKELKLKGLATQSWSNNQVKQNSTCIWGIGSVWHFNDEAERHSGCDII